GCVAKQAGELLRYEIEDARCGVRTNGRSLAAQGDRCGVQNSLARDGRTAAMQAELATGDFGLTTQLQGPAPPSSGKFQRAEGGLIVGALIVDGQPPILSDAERHERDLPSAADVGEGGIY